MLKKAPAGQIRQALCAINKSDPYSKVPVYKSTENILTYANSSLIYKTQKVKETLEN